MTKEIERYLKVYLKQSNISGILFIGSKIYYTEDFVEWLTKYLQYETE